MPYTSDWLNDGRPHDQSAVSAEIQRQKFGTILSEHLKALQRERGAAKTGS